jgi:hypothetical protein
MSVQLSNDQKKMEEMGMVRLYQHEIVEYAFGIIQQWQPK